MTSTTDSTRTATTEQLPVVDAARLTVNGLDHPWTAGLTVEAVVRDLLGEGAPAARATGTPADTGCATGVAVALDDVPVDGRPLAEHRLVDQLRRAGDGVRLALVDRELRDEREDARHVGGGRAAQDGAVVEGLHPVRLSRSTALTISLLQ